MRLLGLSRGSWILLGAGATILIVGAIGISRPGNPSGEDGLAPTGPPEQVDRRRSSEAQPADDRSDRSHAREGPSDRPTNTETDAPPAGALQATADTVVALGRRGDPAAAERLGEIVVNGTDEEVQLKAVVALGQNWQPEAIVQLVEALTASDSHRVKQRARKILLRRLRVGFAHPPPPENEAAWAAMVETIRRLPAVRKAYAASSGHSSYENE